MPTPTAGMTRTERIGLLLSCLALDRRLGGILFVDLPPALLAPLARYMASMLADGTDDAEIVTLGSTQTDDDLWWRTRLTARDGNPWFETGPGPLMDMPGDPAKTVIVPDLAGASLAVVRAAVTLVGADVAVADRDGRHYSWQPRSRWMAACARSDLGRLSPHLLDRFALRVDAADLRPAMRDPRSVRNTLDSPGGDESAHLELPEPTFHGQWGSPTQIPAMSSAAIDLIVSTNEAVSVPTRRDLMLARVARALASFDSNDVVLEEHVRWAAALLGLRRSATIDSSAPTRTTDTSSDARPGTPHSPTTPEPRPSEPTPTPVQIVLTGNQRSSLTPLDDLTVTPEIFRDGIYPEDDPDVISEYTPLRQSWQGSKLLRAARGQITGTEPTHILTDIAVVPTAFEAAKFQPIRRRANLGSANELVIVGSDLRRYRHQPRPDTAVILVLDHTCRHGWDISTALAPYLRWAYVCQATLSVIEIGYLGTPNEFRATAYRTSSVLDRRVAISLNRMPGRATPLAHALDLSTQELRRHLRQTEILAQNSWLIVVSDGRGNVPLEASHRGRISGMVSREGVTDALCIASAMRSVPAVHKIVLPPPGITHCAGLPFELADAMAGMVADGTG